MNENKEFREFFLRTLAKKNSGRIEIILTFVEVKVSPDLGADLRQEILPLIDEYKEELENEKKEQEEKRRKAEQEAEKEKSEIVINPLGIFLDMFNRLGNLPFSTVTLQATDYSFHENIFSVQGYYEIPRENMSPLRLQMVSMGFKTDEGIYTMDFRVPIEDDHKDAQRLLTLIKTTKILK